MKVYNKIVISMTTNEVLEEDSFEYSGPLALCGGDGAGSGGGEGGSPGDGEGEGSGLGGGNTGDGSIGGQGADASGEGIGIGADATAGTAGIGTGIGDIGGMPGSVGGNTGDPSGEGTSSGAPDGESGVSLGDVATPDNFGEMSNPAESEDSSNSVSTSASVSIGMNSSLASTVSTAASIAGIPAPVSTGIGLVAGLVSGSSVSPGNIGTSSPIGGTNTADAAPIGTGVDGTTAGTAGNSTGDNAGISGDAGGVGPAAGGRENNMTDTSSPTFMSPEENPPTVNPIPDTPVLPNDNRGGGIQPRDRIGQEFEDRYGYSDLFRFRNSDYDVYIPELSGLF